MSTDAVILTGSAHPKFAEDLAASLGSPLGKLNRSAFPNDEVRVRVIEDLSGKDVVVVQTLSAPAERHFLEFSLIVDAARSLGPKRVFGVIPWFAYSLQDRDFLKGEPISTRVVAGFLDSLRLDGLLGADLHSPLVRSYITTPFLEISEAEIFAGFLKASKTSETVIVAPDQGAAERTRKIAQELDCPFVGMRKKRNLETGAIITLKLEGKVVGKHCIVCDDVIITGGTLIKSAELLKRRGASSVTVCCTHPVFAAGSTDKLQQSQIDRIIVSDTVAWKKTKAHTKLDSISCIPSLAEKLNVFIKGSASHRVD